MTSESPRTIRMSPASMRAEGVGLNVMSPDSASIMPMTTASNCWRKLLSARDWPARGALG